MSQTLPVTDTVPVMEHTSNQDHGVPHRSSNRACQKVSGTYETERKCRDYAQPGQQYTGDVLCVYQACSLRPQADLPRDANTRVFMPIPSAYLSDRDCCEALHLFLDSPAFQSCFMPPLQNNLYLNIFLMSTWAVICSREAKFPPAMFCNQKHACTTQHLLSDLLHGHSSRPWFRRQLFSIDISPEYD